MAMHVATSITSTVTPPGRQMSRRDRTTVSAARPGVVSASAKEFAPFRLDTVNECLWRHESTGSDERIRLTPKAFAMLRYLVEHAGRLVTQDELLQALWPETYVQPEVLKSHIRDIRAALGDDAKSPRFIETLPRRGYRFVASVSEGSSEKGLEVESPAGMLVGRDGELDRLRGALQSALRGSRQLVFITGELGIGKTSLADAFQRQAAADHPGLRIARGQCVEGFGGKEPYYPMLDALGQLSQQEHRNSISQILAATAPAWLMQFPSMVNRDQREKRQRGVLGAGREGMLREIADALESMTETSPMILLFEDLQWVDPSTVDLISAVARRRQHAKLLIIGTYRPVDVLLAEHPLKALKQDLLVHRLCHEIALEPLDRVHVAEYLAAESGGAALSEGLAGLIYQYSEGNPLFMVAALAHLTERGSILRENGSWKLNQPQEKVVLEVPESLRQLIETQIEHLSVEEQRALAGASVTGASFSTAVSSVAANMDVENFERLCDRLSRRHQLIRSADFLEFPGGAVSTRYQFVHALYREVMYRHQSTGRRANLHKCIGARLEELYAGHENEIAAELAHHFEQAAEWALAAKYLRLAAGNALQRFAPREAAAIMRHASELVLSLPEGERREAEIETPERLEAAYDAAGDSWLIEACR